MAQLTIEQVANHKMGERHYFVAYDHELEDGRKASHYPLSPYFSEPEEAKAWQANYTGSEVTYCIGGESF
jgi:hypothetical protein